MTEPEFPADELDTVEVELPDEIADEITEEITEESTAVLPLDEPLGDRALEEGEEAPPAKTVYRGSGVRWGFVAGLLLAVLLVILVFQNTDTVPFSFLIWDVETPLAALLIATAVIAAVTDELVGLVVRAMRRRRLKEREELKRLRDQSR